MRKLSKYLFMDFLAVFATAMLLITFAFSIGGIYKAVDVMAKGFPVAVVGKFFLANLPYAMAYTIPISALFSTLLLFGRLSSDSEISAMKSGGLSLWQIASPVVLFSVFLVGICLYNNFVVYPRTTYANRKLIKSLGVDDPIKLLEEGRFIREFPGMMIYVGQKNRNRVRDLIVYKLDKQGRVTDTVRAGSGILTSDAEKSLLKIDLYDVRIEVPNRDYPDDASKVRYINAKKYPIRIDINELTGKRTVWKKRKNLTFTELVYKLRHPDAELGWMAQKDLRVEQMCDRIEFHQRICLALSPLMFVLIAIPLGIKSHRRESSMGMLMSLGIMFIYYIFIILSDTFDKYPHVPAWLFPWIPIVFGQIGGLLLMRRAN